MAGAPAALPRAQSRWSSLTPAASAEPTSNVSWVSMSAATSPRAAAAASEASSRLVRPDDTGPTISEVSPHGHPPARRGSSHGRPVVTARTGSDGAPASVTVRSSRRARSSASMCSRAACMPHFRLYFAIRQVTAWV